VKGGCYGRRSGHVVAAALATGSLIVVDWLAPHSHKRVGVRVPHGVLVSETVMHWVAVGGVTVMWLSIIVGLLLKQLAGHHHRGVRER